jgi:hypothetical protein
LPAEAAESDLAFWRALFRRHFDIRRDHEAMVGGLDLDDSRRGGYFDGLRRGYPDRLEYSRFEVDRANAGDYAQVLETLGFVIGG